MYDRLSYGCGDLPFERRGPASQGRAGALHHRRVRCPRFRRLSAVVAIVAVLTLGLFTIVSAQWGPWHRLMRFDDVWIGTMEADTYTAPSASRDRIIGRGGDDVLNANDSNDLVRGNTGDDTLDGEAGDDLLVGGPGNDTITGGDGRDLVRGNPGDDTLDGEAGDDFLVGGPGNDTITGGPGRDIIRAGSGDDTILTADGERDWVRCGTGEDTVTADPSDRVAANCEEVITP